MATVRYVISPVRPEHAREYVHAHVALLVTTYAHLVDGRFAAARRAEIDQRVAELLEDLAETEAADAAGRPPFRWHLIAHTARGAVVGVAASGEGIGVWERPHLGQAWTPPATTFCLDHLYTAPGTHGTGLGQALLDAALPGRRAAFCWVFADNPRALAFYARNGFVPDGLAAGTGADWGDVEMIRLTRPDLAE